ncbi:MAG: hypothetical protein JZD40_00175, partial [Sulfolobus sp.]|nr:hypothetical protein [Sulfolobus sp.]
YQSSVYPPLSGVMNNPLDQIVNLTSNEYYNGEVIFKIPATATPEYIEYMTLAGQVLFKVPAVKPTLFYIWIGDIYLQSNDTSVVVSSNSILANLEMFSNQTLTLNISATNDHFITPVKLVGVQIQGPSGFKVVLPQNEIGEVIQPGQSVNLEAYLYAPANYTGYVNQITITLEFQDM